MKKAVCLYFQLHIPYLLRRYRFFDIGNNHDYYDDFDMRMHIQRVATYCYLPMNKILLDIIKELGNDFKVSFSITGTTLELLEKYAPNALMSFQKLTKTGCVEFVCETYSHSLAFLKSEDELKRQLEKQCKTIYRYFKQKPSVVRLTGLIYSDGIGEALSKLGFIGVLTEGAKHTLGWKSPDFLYTNAKTDRLTVMLRDYRLSDDIAFRFSDKNWDGWPLTCEKFVAKMDAENEKGDVLNIFMDYLTFGCRHLNTSGIFDFIRYLPGKLLERGTYDFQTPSEVIANYEPVGTLRAPYPISWSEEERDLSVWLGNELQKDAFESLFNLADKVYFTAQKDILSDWERLQDSDHFYYMCTKWLEEGTTQRFENVYPSPYDAYINYMNVLSDFILRVNEAVDGKIKKLMKDKKIALKLAEIHPLTAGKYSASQIRKIISIVNKEAKKSKNKSIST